MTAALGVFAICCALFAIAIWFDARGAEYFARLLWARARALEASRETYREVFRAVFNNLPQVRR